MRNVNKNDKKPQNNNGKKIRTYPQGMKIAIIKYFIYTYILRFIG